LSGDAGEIERLELAFRETCRRIAATRARAAQFDAETCEPPSAWHAQFVTAVLEAGAHVLGFDVDHVPPVRWVRDAGASLLGFADIRGISLVAGAGALDPETLAETALHELTHHAQPQAAEDDVAAHARRLTPGVLSAAVLRVGPCPHPDLIRRP
jgi:hypothetical protein